MNKQEFLTALSERLGGLAQEDIDKSTEYYSEMIEDRVEDGLSEEEAVAALGSVDEISSRILLDTPLPKLVKAKVTPDRTLRAWEIILIVLGAPIWLSLVLAALAVVLSLYIAIWAVALALYLVVFTLALSAVVCIVCAVVMMFTSGFWGGLAVIGAALICAALAMLLFCGTFYAVKGIAFLSKAILRGIKYCFIGKENSK